MWCSAWHGEEADHGTHDLLRQASPRNVFDGNGLVALRVVDRKLHESMRSLPESLHTFEARHMVVLFVICDRECRARGGHALRHRSRSKCGFSGTLPTLASITLLCGRPVWHRHPDMKT